MFIPNSPVGELPFIFCDAFFDPTLLNPSLFINASSSSNLNTLGLGFPYWGSGVIVPTSTNPNPNLNNELYTSAFLSKPAAIPIGFGISFSKNFTFREA